MGVGDLALAVVGVVQDHPGAAGDEHGFTLGYPGDRSPLAEHDLAGNTTGVECPGVAQLIAGIGGIDERQLIRSRSDRRSEELPAVAGAGRAPERRGSACWHPPK